MTVTVLPLLLLDDVAVGDPMPELRYEVSATTVVLGASATRTGVRCITTRTSP